LGHFVLPPGILQELHANESKLAGLQVPGGLDPGTEAGIRGSIRGAFVFGFRIVMLICGGLALMGAAVAWVMIRNDRGRVA
jgi:hypothetical protein